MTQSNERGTTTLMTCSTCKGTGFVIVQEETDGFYGTDAEGNTRSKVLDYAKPCPACNGGHDNMVFTVKKNADIPMTYYNSDMSCIDWSKWKDSDGNTIKEWRNENGSKIIISQVKTFVESFVKDFKTWEDAGIGLYLYSSTRGSGKTFIASCVCNELMKDRTLTTRFVKVSDLLSIAQSGNKDSYNEYEKDPIKLLCNCKLLVLDDIGQKTTGNAWLQDILFRILDSRMNQKLVTIMTSNVKLDDLPLDDRLVDRCNRVMQVIPLPNYCVRSEEANTEKRELFKKLGLIGNSK